MASEKAPFLPSFLNKLSYSQIFMVICCLFLLAIFLPTYFMIESQNAAIKLAEKQLEDTQHLREILMNHPHDISERDILAQRDLLIGTIKDLTSQTSETPKLVGIILTFFCALVATALSLAAAKGLSRSLSDLGQAAEGLAHGELSTRVEIDRHEEMGKVGIAFNAMAESFQKLIKRLHTTGSQLSSSATEVARAAKYQETNVLQQETTTKEIEETAKGVSSTAKYLANTMSEINHTAEQTSALATAGKAGLTHMETIMRQMVDASQDVAGKLAILNDKASNITGVVTTITKVADKTNLLSLNAAIEAEKAGEHGRTFSVIAQEIRRLADQTANATFDIEKMVREIVSAVSAGVMGVDKFSEEIKTGVSQLSTVNEQLTKILEQVQLQTHSFESVNKGMQVQSLSAEQMHALIHNLIDTSQHASESMRTFYQTIQQLNSTAKGMQSAVENVKN